MTRIRIMVDDLDKKKSLTTRRMGGRLRRM